MALRTKFNMVLLGSGLVGFGLAAVLSYSLTFEGARREVLAQATLMDAQATAISRYTADEVAP